MNIYINIPLTLPCHFIFSLANADKLLYGLEAMQFMRNEAKIKRAEATIALASGNRDLAGDLKREAERYDEIAIGSAAEIKEITAQLVELKTGNTKAKLIDKVIALRDEIKAAGVIDGDINAMTIGDLIDYLA